MITRLITLFTLITATLALVDIGPTDAQPTMALDGHASSKGYACSMQCASATLSTTHTNDVIVVVAQCGIFASCGDTMSSITDDDGHAWTLRVAYTASRPIWEYYTIARSPLLSDKINATWAGSNIFVGFVVFGVSGANTQHPWDPSRTLPARTAVGSGCVFVNNSCSIRFSTVAAQNFVIVSTAINDAPLCQGISPFQNLDSATYGLAEVDFLVTNKGGSNGISFTCGGSSPMTILGDAIMGPGSHE